MSKTTKAGLQATIDGLRVMLDNKDGEILVLKNDVRKANVLLSMSQDDERHAAAEIHELNKTNNTNGYKLEMVAKSLSIALYTINPED